MPTLTSRNGMIAVRPEDARYLKLLGHIVFYSIPDGYQQVAAIASAFEAAGLPAQLVPPPAKALHRFQAACRSVEQRRSDARDCEVKVAQIDEDEQVCLYQVHFLVRDRQNRVVEHPKGLRVTFEKRGGTITFEQLRGSGTVEEHLLEADLPDLQGLQARIREFHLATANCVPGSKLRTIIRGILAGAHAEVMRDSGGVYFVPISGERLLTQVRQALRTIFPHDADFAAIPVADDEEKRQMVRRRLTVNTVPVIDEVLGKVTQALRTADAGKPVREITVSNLFAERRRLKGLHAEYATLLKDELSELTEKIAVLDQQLETLADRAG